MTRIEKIVAGIIALTMIVALLPQSSVKAAGKTVTVKNQKELNAALKDPSITQINIETKKKVTLTIKSGDYSKVSISINAPKATIKDNGSFKKVTIDDAKKFNEYSSGNSIVVNDSALTLTTDKDAEIKKLTLSSDTGKVTVNNTGTISAVSVKGAAEVDLAQNGKMGKVTVAAAADISISGESASKVSVTVKAAAEGASIESSLPVKVSAYGDVELSLKEGAEKSSISLKNENAGIALENNTAKTISVTDSDGKKEKVKAGKELVSENYEVNEDKDDSAEPSTDTPAVTPEPTPETTPTPSATPSPEPTETPKPTTDPAGGTGSNGGIPGGGGGYGGGGGSTGGGGVPSGGGSTGGGTTTPPVNLSEATVANWSEFVTAINDSSKTTITIAGRVELARDVDVAEGVTVKFATGGSLVLPDATGLYLYGTLITSESAAEIVPQGGLVVMPVVEATSAAEWKRGTISFRTTGELVDFGRNYDSGKQEFYVFKELTISDPDGRLSSLGMTFTSENGGKVILNGTDYYTDADGRLTTTRSAYNKVAWELHNSEEGDTITVSDIVEIPNENWLYINKGRTLKFASGGKLLFAGNNNRLRVEGTLITSADASEIACTGIGGAVSLLSCKLGDNEDPYICHGRWQRGNVVLSNEYVFPSNLTEDGINSIECYVDTNLVIVDEKLDISGNLADINAFGWSFLVNQGGKIFVNGTEHIVKSSGELVNLANVIVANWDEFKEALSYHNATITISGRVEVSEITDISEGTTIKFVDGGVLVIANQTDLYGTIITSEAASEIIIEGDGYFRLCATYGGYQGKWIRGRITFEEVCYENDEWGWSVSVYGKDITGEYSIGIFDELIISDPDGVLAGLDIRFYSTTGGKVYMNGTEYSIDSNGAFTTERSNYDILARSLRRSESGDIITVSDVLEIPDGVWLDVEKDVTLRIVNGGKLVFTGSGALRVRGTLESAADISDIVDNGNNSYIDLRSTKIERNGNLIEFHGEWKIGNVTVTNNGFYDPNPKGWERSLKYMFNDNKFYVEDRMDIDGAAGDIDSLNQLVGYKLSSEDGKIFVNGVEQKINILGELVPADADTSITVDNANDFISVLDICNNLGDGEIVIDEDIELSSESMTYYPVRSGVSISFTDGSSLTLNNYCLEITGTLSTSIDAEEIICIGDSSRITLNSMQNASGTDVNHGKWIRGSIILEDGGNGGNLSIFSGGPVHFYEGQQKKVEVGTKLVITGDTEVITNLGFSYYGQGSIFINGTEYATDGAGSLTSPTALSRLVQTLSEAYEGETVIVDEDVEIGNNQYISILPSITVKVSDGKAFILSGGDLRIYGGALETSGLDDQIRCAESTGGRIVISADNRNQRGIEASFKCGELNFQVEGDENAADWSSVFVLLGNSSGQTVMTGISLVRNPTLTISGLTVDQAKQLNWYGTGTVVIGGTEYTITDGVWPE